MKTQVNCQVVI